jgi:hypothetical protein
VTFPVTFVGGGKKIADIQKKPVPVIGGEYLSSRARIQAPTFKNICSSDWLSMSCRSKLRNSKNTCSYDWLSMSFAYVSEFHVNVIVDVTGA